MKIWVLNRLFCLQNLSNHLTQVVSVDFSGPPRTSSSFNGTEGASATILIRRTAWSDRLQLKQTVEKKVLYELVERERTSFNQELANMRTTMEQKEEIIKQYEQDRQGWYMSSFRIHIDIKVKEDSLAQAEQKIKRFKDGWPVIAKLILELENLKSNSQIEELEQQMRIYGRPCKEDRWVEGSLSSKVQREFDRLKEVESILNKKLADLK